MDYVPVLARNGGEERSTKHKRRPNVAQKQRNPPTRSLPWMLSHPSQSAVTAVTAALRRAASTPIKPSVNSRLALARRHRVIQDDNSDEGDVQPLLPRPQPTSDTFKRLVCARKLARKRRAAKKTHVALAVNSPIAKTRQITSIDDTDEEDVQPTQSRKHTSRCLVRVGAVARRRAGKAPVALVENSPIAKPRRNASIDDDTDEEEALTGAEPVHCQTKPTSQATGKRLVRAAEADAAETASSKRPMTNHMEAWVLRTREESSVLDLTCEDEVTPRPPSSDSGYLTHLGTLRRLGHTLMMKVASAHLDRSFKSELVDMVTLPATMQLAHGYEDGYVLQLARMLDRGLCVPQKTSTFALSNGQRMQVAHLACILAVQQQERTLRAVYACDNDNIDTSLSIRSDGGLQRLQVLVAPAGSGKSAVVAAVVATRLCRRNWNRFPEQVRDDQLRAPTIAPSQHVPLKPIAVVVCPPGLVQQWQREATALLHGPDCRPGAAFEAGWSGAEWKILTSHNIEQTRELLRDSVAITSPQLWIIASEYGPSKPYSPVLLDTSVRIAIAIYDECTYTFAKEPLTGSGYSVPMTILVTASVRDIVDATRNTPRHPLRIALTAAGACTDTDLASTRWSDPNTPTRVSTIASLLPTHVQSASSKIRLTMALRLFIGPPELPLLQEAELRAPTDREQVVFFSLPYYTLALERGHVADEDGVRVLTLWDTLRRHFRYIRASTSSFKPSILRKNDLFGDAITRLQAAEASGASVVYDELFVHLDVIAKTACPWYKRSLVLLRVILKGAEQLAKEGAKCPVCIESVDANLLGGPTNCCGGIMCIACAKKLAPVKCPLCREETLPKRNCSEFSIVQTVGVPPPAVLTQVLSQLPQSPVATGNVGDEVLHRACARIHASQLDLYDAFSTALHLALMARAGSTPRVLVFFGSNEPDRVSCKIRIKEIARDANVHDIEGITDRFNGSISTAVARAIPAFADPVCTKPVFLLCDVDHNSRSIAGADLSAATAVIVVGSLWPGAETQLLGRIVRRSQQRDTPPFRVFFLRTPP